MAQRPAGRARADRRCIHGGTRRPVGDGSLWHDGFWCGADVRAEGGSDRLIENRVAEGGSDRLIQNRTA